VVAVRETTKSDPGTTSYSFGPSWRHTAIHNTYLVNDFLKMDFNAARFQVLVRRGRVNESRELLLAHLFGLEAKHKQQGVNDVGLARPVRSHDGRKGLKCKRNDAGVPCGRGRLRCGRRTI
jgi:hypothetical protein